jgi:hypothetical protein
MKDYFERQVTTRRILQRNAFMGPRHAERELIDPSEVLPTDHVSVVYECRTCHQEVKDVTREDVSYDETNPVRYAYYRTYCVCPEGANK